MGCVGVRERSVVVLDIAADGTLLNVEEVTRRLGVDPGSGVALEDLGGGCFALLPEDAFDLYLPDKGPSSADAA